MFVLVHVVQKTLGPIHTGRARANSNANPLMLLVCIVDTPIHINRSHLLAPMESAIPPPHCVVHGGWQQRSTLAFGAKSLVPDVSIDFKCLVPEHFQHVDWHHTTDLWKLLLQTTSA